MEWKEGVVLEREEKENWKQEREWWNWKEGEVRSEETKVDPSENSDKIMV